METSQGAPTKEAAQKTSRSPDVQDLLAKVKEYLPPEKLQTIEEAYAYAARCHEGQLRASGEPYIVHPLHTAILLADLQLDASTITAALLHDVPEDCGIPLEGIEEGFGAEVRKLVDGATKVSKIELQLLESRSGARRSPEDERLQAESLRKMLVAMAEDVRVVLIKLADRLHNMRTLDALPEDRRLRIARETLDVFAPLAHRLGVWQFKWQLEDLAFRHLEPEKYREISRFLAAKRAEREKHIEEATNTLRLELEKAGIKAEVTGRPKSIYSIHKKMQKYAAQGKDLAQIYDLFAVRVLVDDMKDCYAALGVVHALWHPLPGQFDDYIGNPKENLYQALHTTVMCQGMPLEVQVRTVRMHRVAEYGVAAHWRYKEAISREDMKFEEKMTWLRQLLEWQRDVTGTEEFLESVRTDIFRDQVFVYTPKGDIVELPASSTPLDFAYRIHTDLGHRCVGAKVNGKLVSLDYQLQNGNTVEIVVSKVARGPSLDWLNPDLGYLRTAGAREKVRQWFRKQERTINVQRGREALLKEIRRLGITISEEEVASLLKFDSVDDLLAAIGCGNITLQQVTARVIQQEPQQAPATPAPTAAPPSGEPAGVTVLGVGDLLTRVAQCCHPLPGDEILGFITRTRGVTVHRKDCPNVLNQDEKGRLVPVQWGPTQQVYPVRVRVEAWDRVGLLRDITNVVAEEKVNIAGVQSIDHPDRTVTIYMTLHTTGIQQLSRLFARIEGVKSVMSAQRSNDGV